MSLEQVVATLASRPAEAVELKDRGRIAPGYKVDINVLDLANMRLHAPHVRHDLPSGGRRLDQCASGYVATLCSGKLIRRDDEATAERPGRAVRGPQMSVRQAEAAL